MANNASISNISIDLTELSADTSPQLGGNLDLNSNDITGTGNINTTGTITASSTITGNTFSGSGASLTNLNASNLASVNPVVLESYEETSSQLLVDAELAIASFGEVFWDNQIDTIYDTLKASA